MNYPNGQKVGGYKRSTISTPNHGFGNRGMSLEEDINTTNTHYLAVGQAVIHKKPTPIQIVKVNYPKRSAAVITEAYFKQASTTDYNGLYRHKYIDFEAKETKNKTRFPLANIHAHQIKHMQDIIQHGGIAFIVIRFTVLEETYYIPAENLFIIWDEQKNGGKKSLSYDLIQEIGYIMPLQYQIRVDYLSIIDELYF